MGLNAGDDLHDAVGHQWHLPLQPRPPNVMEVSDGEHVAVLGDRGRHETETVEVLMFRETSYLVTITLLLQFDESI